LVAGPSQFLLEVQPGEISEVATGRIIVSVGGLYLGGVIPEVDLAPINRYLSAERATARLEVDTLESRCALVTVWSLISDVLRVSADPQIRAAIVQRVSVDVVNDLSGLGVHDKAVQGNLLPRFPLPGLWATASGLPSESIRTRHLICDTRSMSSRLTSAW
jgi:hypothetical protein